MTLGENVLRPRGAGTVADSGSRSTSIARARLASRLMKPRSSSAMIRRWMPDLDLQVERLLHFVERRRHALGLQALVDEAQQFALFSRQHRNTPGAVATRFARCGRQTARIAARRKQIANKAYLFAMRSARRMTRARLKAAPGPARRASLATETRSGPPGKAPEITPAKRKASLAKSSVSFCPLQPFEMFDMRNPRFRGFSCFQSFTGRFISRLFFAARIRGGACSGVWFSNSRILE